MAETQAMVMKLYPAAQRERGERVFSEQDVKTILYGFARDIEKKRSLKAWRADRLRTFIETVFDFD